MGNIRPRTDSFSFARPFSGCFSHVRSDPRDVVGAIELSRATYQKMIQNLVWATAYNLVAIPVAAGVFGHWGLDLPMSVGAVAMSLSSIIVAANAQLLRRLKLQSTAP